MGTLCTTAISACHYAGSASAWWASSSEWMALIPTLVLSSSRFCLLKLRPAQTAPPVTRLHDEQGSPAIALLIAQ